MKVLLSHGYFIYEDEKEQEIMRPYPPLGILYISSFLKERGISTQVFDTTFSSKEELIKSIEENKPDILALYTNLMTKLNVLTIIDEVKSSFPKIKIILGGPDVTYNIENYLEAGSDFIVIGEGENTMYELACSLRDNQDADEVNGIAYLKDGNVHKTAARVKQKEIDSLPIPDRDSIDVGKYLSTWKDHHGMSTLNVSTQRGCPYTCKWCSTAVYGQSYRRRSPKNVALELKEIKEKYNPDSIWFVDDVFTVSHKWLSEMADELDKHDIHIPFECISRADRMNTEVIKILKRMGCFRIWIGAESGSQRIIDAMDRRVSVDKVREMIIEARKEGIEAGTFIMIGYPGETEEDIKETIHHLKVSNPDHFTITVAYPIKGTSLYNEVEGIQTKELDWNKTTDRDRDFTRTYPKKYYQYATSWVVNEVNFHKKLKEKKIGKDLFVYKLKSVISSTRMILSKRSTDG